MLRKGELSAVALDLGEVVRDVARLLASAALLAGATLRIELAPGLPRVRSDGAELQQVLLNRRRAMHGAPRDELRQLVSSVAACRG